MNFKQILDQLISTPLLTSLFIVDFAILMFHKPPAFFSLLMLGVLVALAMYFGQKLGLYTIKKQA
ncbi:MAG: hypothetical protein L0Y38_07960 [Methylococcaceae bacterium]|nr:hypothetical protein [Methylococcaceae bacterium]MCI0666863.1 hypothetical protein [Methylococcaceae bacterium]MCI0733740.1 hypothetical protein [Methylococcaceae bacterium]